MLHKLIGIAMRRVEGFIYAVKGSSASAAR
jgi:hypothetical protein